MSANMAHAIEVFTVQSLTPLHWHCNIGALNPGALITQGASCLGWSQFYFSAHRVYVLLVAY